MLMKITGKELSYKHQCWYKDELLNEDDKDEDNEANAKYDTYNDLKLSKLMLVDVESGRFTILKLPERQSLLWYI